MPRKGQVESRNLFKGLILQDYCFKDIDDARDFPPALPVLIKNYNYNAAYTSLPFQCSIPPWTLPHSFLDELALVGLAHLVKKFVQGHRLHNIVERAELHGLST
jgi:hypothetical protein